MHVVRTSSLTKLWVCARRAKEWDDVDKAEKEKIELIKKEDGEFW